MVAANDGQEYGPFAVPDTSGSHHFEVISRVQALRFSQAKTSGDNMGAVNIVVYSRLEFDN